MLDQKKEYVRHHSEPHTNTTAPCEQWILKDGVQYLDHGAFGGVPKIFLKEQYQIRCSIEAGPQVFFERYYVSALCRSKEALASFLGVDVDGLVLVTGATHALNVVLQSQRLSPGDEILTTNFVYSSVKHIIDTVAQRDGATVVVAEIKFPVESNEEIISNLLEHVTEYTRTAAIDHVPSRPGIIMPIKEIVDKLTARGVEVVVDGAHVPGMFPLDIKNIDAPYYVGNCHKWMCAPRGIGFVYARKDRRRRLRPLVIARSPYADDAHKHSALENQFDWPGTFDPSAVLTLPKVIEFLQTVVPGGHAALFERNHRIALAARDILCQRLGLVLPTPDHFFGTMVSIPLPDSTEPDNKGITSIQQYLWAQHQTQVPIYPWPSHPQRLLRISVQLYNSLDQYRQLAENIAAFLSHERPAICRSVASERKLDGNKINGKAQLDLPCCDPMVRCEMPSAEPRRQPLPRKSTNGVRWPSWSTLVRLSMDRILYFTGLQEEPPHLLFPTAESENGQHFLSIDWKQFGNLEAEKARLMFTLSHYLDRGIPSRFVHLIIMLLQSPCVLEGWSTDLFQHLRYEGLSVVCESLSSSPSVYSTAAKTTYGVERIGSHLSRSLWERALESIPSHTKDPGNDVNESIIMAFIQVHAFVKDPIDGLRRDFDRQRQTFLELWTDFKRQYSTRRPLNESTRQTIFAQLAQESSFLAIPKLTKLAYLHYSDHQQLPYAYASIKKLRRAEFSTPIRVLEIVRELFLMTMDQGFSSMAPITVTYRPGADRQGRRFKVVLDGNNRLVAISLLQFLSYQPLSTERGALQNFFQKLGYDEKWLAELDEVLNKLRQEKSLLQLVQDHSNALEYFRSVTRAPILIVQEDEFHTVSVGEGSATVLQPYHQTVHGCSSCLAFEAKRQSHGRPKGFYPLPLQ